MGSWTTDVKSHFNDSTPDLIFLIFPVDERRIDAYTLSRTRGNYSMKRPWQESIVVHHINGNPRDNRPENLCFVHLATSKPLDELELEQYYAHLVRQRVRRGR